MSDLIAALDRALAGYGEDITLRRVTGIAPNQVTADVTCRAKVTASGVEQGPGGVTVTHYDIVISPTQIRDRGWPGGQFPAVPPFDRDQSIPRALTDKVLLRGQPPIALTFVDPVFVNGEWVRANMKAVG
ncbi:hypothetical protein [Bradyrhizobium sp. SZCCHNR1020]|uniref:hypothetical protein n=1 Tax=Bradyrhizobium sp. SZCCHNR1020 TaxID=3057343 RepID=UPI0029168618|nr:hypothetical protein [Bradyrhizobium sp. SZCCHNR1020]